MNTFVSMPSKQPKNPLVVDRDDGCPFKVTKFDLKRGQHMKYWPYAFTEHGILMLSSVLNSERAIRVNIAIMRAFMRLRKILESHAELARKLEELEKKYDSQFRVVFEAIRQVMAPKETPSKRIGFQLREKRATYSTRG